MNQNLNNCENGGVAQQLDLMVQSADAPVAEVSAMHAVISAVVIILWSVVSMCVS